MRQTMRKIHVCGVTWEYRIGKANAVLEAPGRPRLVVDLVTLTGRSWDAIERGHWKKTPDGMITPADIAGYIERLGGGEARSKVVMRRR